MHPLPGNVAQRGIDQSLALQARDAGKGSALEWDAPNIQFKNNALTEVNEAFFKVVQVLLQQVTN